MTRSQAAPIVVLADLAPEGTSTDLEPGDALAVQKGKLRQALTAARITLELELAEDGRLTREHTVDYANHVVCDALGLAPENLVRVSWLTRDLHALDKALTDFINVLRRTRLLAKGPAEDLEDPARHSELRAALRKLQLRPLELVTQPSNEQVRAARALLRCARALSGRPLVHELGLWVDKYTDSVGPDQTEVRRVAATVLLAAALEPVDQQEAASTQEASRLRLLETLEALRLELRDQLSDLLAELYAAPATRALEPLIRDLDRLSKHSSFVLIHCPRTLFYQPNAKLLERFAECRPRVVVTPHRLDPRSQAGLIESWTQRSQKLGAVFAADAALELASPIAEKDITLPWQRLLESQRGGFVLFPQRYLTRGSYGPLGEPNLLQVSLPLPSLEERPWGSVALFTAPCLAAPEGPIASLELQRYASDDDSGYNDPPPASGPLPAPLSRVAPPAADDLARRWRLGLCDVHAQAIGSRRAIHLLVPHALMGRTPDGRLAHSGIASSKPSAASPIVVLADLAPEGTSGDLEPGDLLLVAQGKPSAMLSAASIALEFDVPAEHRIDPDDPGEEFANFTIRGTESFAPNKLVQALPLGAELASLLTGLNGFRIVLMATRLEDGDPVYEFLDPAAHWQLRLALTASRMRPIELVTQPLSESVRLVRGELLQARAQSGLPLGDQLHAWFTRIGGGGLNADELRTASNVLALAALEPHGGSAPPTAKESRNLLREKLQALIFEVQARLSKLLTELYEAACTRALEPLIRDLVRLCRASSFTLIHCPRALLEQPSDELLARFAELRARVVVTPHRLDPRVDAALIEAWTARSQALGAVFVADTALDLAGPIAADDVPPAWQHLLATQRGAFMLFPQRYLTRASFSLSGEPDKLLPVELPPSAHAPWGSVALFLAPHLAAPQSTRNDLELTVIASAKDADCYDSAPEGESANETVLRSRVDPAPPVDQLRQRWAIGLCDVHAQRGRGKRPDQFNEAELFNLLVPSALLGRSAAGRLAQPLRATELHDRKAFWRGGQRCLRCQAPTVQVRQVEGCRMNGDAWGTVDFTCACGWSTWLAFDDAFDIDGAYYFETKDWAREDAG